MIRISQQKHMQWPFRIALLTKFKADDVYSYAECMEVDRAQDKREYLGVIKDNFCKCS